MVSRLCGPSHVISLIELNLLRFQHFYTLQNILINFESTVITSTSNVFEEWIAKHSFMFTKA